MPARGRFRFDTSDLSPGACIGEHFRLDAELGGGGMGRVFRATDLRTSEQVALKVVRPEFADDVQVRQRFEYEWAALAAIEHPAVVRVRERGEAGDGLPFLVLELLEGETLADRLERDGPIELEELLPIAKAICEAIEAAHFAGVVHRDIKPSNIFLLTSSEGPAAKVLDFGVARVRSLPRVTESGIAIGTRRYMAPEQLTGGAVDERADVYSLGVAFYEALAGEHPFDRDESSDPIGAILVGRVTPLASLRPELSPALVRVIDKAMARIPTERHASPRQMLDALRAAMGDEPTALDQPVVRAKTLAADMITRPSPARVGVFQRTAPARRSRGLYLLGALGATALIAGALTLSTGWFRVGNNDAVTSTGIDALALNELDGRAPSAPLPSAPSNPVSSRAVPATEVPATEVPASANPRPTPPSAEPRPTTRRSESALEANAAECAAYTGAACRRGDTYCRRARGRVHAWQSESSPSEVAARCRAELRRLERRSSSRTAERREPSPEEASPSAEQQTAAHRRGRWSREVITEY